ncbi:RNA 3'-terminal phosphate cyclase/enolpyruvate transferase [Bombardia bombarda]|uniref:RNA 3'-terminal phosphate cyclase/enolpyruvate transferase n=1 Tax=Bombardia bombarda TaxID=252184 RepID=A0AA40C4Z2_9PEZI|nr:RNA 3'-terminal phosphate cyclase/enolpyruvate transferase [Bombardia bombarda]
MPLLPTLPTGATTLTLDGTTYEGGGGLIRYAIAYSSILNRPVHIHSIRANRPGRGGLRLEHTVAISTLAELSSAEVIGNQPASREMTFTPHVKTTANGKSLLPLPAELDITVEGAASIFLVAMLPYLLFGNLAGNAYGYQSHFENNSGIRLVIRAGTFCAKAASVLYLKEVLLPTFELIGIGSEHLRLESEYEQGWHTQNNRCPGKMVVHIKPLLKPLPAFVLEHRGEVRSIRATGHVPGHAVERFREILRSEMADAVSNGASRIALEIDRRLDLRPGQPVSPLSRRRDRSTKGLLGLRAKWSVAEGFSSLVANNNERPVSEMNSEAVAIIKPSLRGVMLRQTACTGYTPRSHNGIPPYLDGFISPFQSHVKCKSRYFVVIGCCLGYLHLDAWSIFRQLRSLTDRTARQSYAYQSGFLPRVTKPVDDFSQKQPSRFYMSLLLHDDGQVLFDAVKGYTSLRYLSLSIQSHLGQDR